MRRFSDAILRRDISPATLRHLRLCHAPLFCRHAEMLPLLHLLMPPAECARDAVLMLLLALAAMPYA